MTRHDRPPQGRRALPRNRCADVLAGCDVCTGGGVMNPLTLAIVAMIGVLSWAYVAALLIRSV